MGREKMEDAKAQARSRWRALESNPEVLTCLGRKLGLPEQWVFSDIFGLDPELLAMFPEPCPAVILLFPSSKKTLVQESASGDQLFFIRQLPELGNACGTIAMLHSFANNFELLGFDSQSVMGRFINELKSSSCEERGAALNAHEEINSLHNATSAEGQTAATDGKVDNHFVCFTSVGGELYEIDGMKPKPISHGPLGDKPLINGAAEVIKRVYVDPNPDVLEFALIGLGPPPAF